MTKQLLVAGLAAMLPFTFAAALPFAGQAGGADTPETASQNASKSKTAATDQIPEGTAIDVTLTKAIDAQRSKPGDEVDAKTSAAVKAHGRVIVPKGTKLVGHIVQVKVKSDDEPTSTIVVQFDHAITKSGRETPLRASIASIARPQASASPTDDMPGDMGMPTESMGSPSAAPRAGVGGGGAMTGATSSTGHAKRNSNSGAAPPSAPGKGGADVQPEVAASFTLEQRENGSVISSNSRNVHLDSGTHLLLRVLAAR
jgi:hypothetical protein